MRRTEITAGHFYAVGVGGEHESYYRPSRPAFYVAPVVPLETTRVRHQVHRENTLAVGKGPYNDNGGLLCIRPRDWTAPVGKLALDGLRHLSVALAHKLAQTPDDPVPVNGWDLLDGSMWKLSPVSTRLLLGPYSEQKAAADERLAAKLAKVSAEEQAYGEVERRLRALGIDPFLRDHWGALPGDGRALTVSLVDLRKLLDRYEAAEAPTQRLAHPDPC